MDAQSTSSQQSRPEEKHRTTRSRTKKLLMSVSGVIVCSCIVLASVCGIFYYRLSPSDLLFRLWLVAHILQQPGPPSPSGPPSRLFKLYILDPIPASVKEIRTDHGRTFRFRISRADVDMIVKSRPFREAVKVEYRDGLLDCDCGSGYGAVTVVYPDTPEISKPKWFALETLRDPEGYAIVEETPNTWNMWVLIYSEELGEAYFVVE